MDYEFKKLSDVETAIDIQDTDTILIIQNGSTKQIPKNQITSENAPSVEITYFVTSDSHIRTGQDWSIGSDATREDIVSAYEKGIVKVFVMYNGSLSCVGNVIGYRMYNGMSQPVYIDSNGGAEYI